MGPVRFVEEPAGWVQPKMFDEGYIRYLYAKAVAASDEQAHAILEELRTVLHEYIRLEHMRQARGLVQVNDIVIVGSTSERGA